MGIAVCILCKSFYQASNDGGNPAQVPHWVWLAWVPQLLTGTQRAESAFCKHILKELARLFPQVLPTICTPIAAIGSHACPQHLLLP